MLPAMAGEPDDNALMLRYRAGDTVAFGRLYERHKGPLYRYFL
ncbi:MAG: RNA polymerase subunit sigma-24, partial [Gammaproteobacteria bacterium]